VIRRMAVFMASAQALVKAVAGGVAIMRSAGDRLGGLANTAGAAMLGPGSRERPPGALDPQRARAISAAPAVIPPPAVLLKGVGAHREVVSIAFAAPGSVRTRAARSPTWPNMASGDHLQVDLQGRRPSLLPRSGIARRIVS